MRVAVGLSGGIDSAVALALLKAEGHEVFGLTMRLWQAGRYRGGAKDACFGPGEVADIARAQALCQRLGVPLHVIDCAEAYERHILELPDREVPVKHLNQLRWKTKHRELNSEWDDILGFSTNHR